jgi:hypothetical protein
MRGISHPDIAARPTDILDDESLLPPAPPTFSMMKVLPVDC